MSFDLLCPDESFAAYTAFVLKFFRVTSFMCDRLKALKGALFRLDLTNSLTNLGSWLFKL